MPATSSSHTRNEFVPRANEQPPLAELTRRMVMGDDAAYRLFFTAYAGRLTRYLFVVMRGDEHAAADALQDTLRRVVKYIRVFTDEETFWSWLTVLARSAVADHRRKHRRYLSFLEHFRASRDSEPEPLEPSADARLEEMLNREMASLNVADRELIQLKYHEHVPVREIARRLDATEGAIESRLVRIRRQLREKVLSRLSHEEPL